MGGERVEGPLELASFDELTAEIGRRFPFAVVITLRTAEQHPDLEEFRVKHYGSSTAALGLLDRCKAVIRAALVKLHEGQT